MANHRLPEAYQRKAPPRTMMTPPARRGVIEEALWRWPWLLLRVLEWAPSPHVDVYPQTPGEPGYQGLCFQVLRSVGGGLDSAVAGRQSGGWKCRRRL